MNITNSFFYVTGQGSRDSRFKSEKNIFKLGFKSTIIPLDERGEFIVFPESKIYYLI